MYNNTIISKFQCNLQFKLQLFVLFTTITFWNSDVTYRNALLRWRNAKLEVAQRQLEVQERRSGWI